MRVNSGAGSGAEPETSSRADRRPSATAVSDSASAAMRWYIVGTPNSIVAPSPSAAAAAAALGEGATMLFGVPTMYHRIAAEAESDTAVADGLRSARLLVSGSAPLPAPLFTRIEQATGQQVVERYGLTETLMNTAGRTDGVRKPGYVGLPLPN